MAGSQKKPRGRTGGGRPPEPPRYPMTFIAAWRDKLGISQEELANKAGVDRSSLSKFENALRGHALYKVAQLSIAMEVPPEQLLYRDPNDHSATSIWLIREKVSDLSEKQRALLIGIIDLMLAEVPG